MPKTTLFPYRPSEYFTARLKACGFGMVEGSPQATTRNVEAERLLSSQLITCTPLPHQDIGRLGVVIAAVLIILAFAWPALGDEYEIESVSPEPVESIPSKSITPEIEPPVSDVSDEYHSTAILFMQGATLVSVILILMTLSARKAQMREKLGKSLEGLKAIPDCHQYPVRERASFIIGGASRTGQIRSENQDAFRLWNTSTGHGAIVVCDGVGGHPGGREAAQFAATHLIDFLKSKKLGNAPLPGDCGNALISAQKAFVHSEIKGLTTAIVTTFDDGWLYYAVLGDGGLVVIHGDGMVQNLLAPHHARGQADNIITAYLSAEQTFAPRMGSVRIDAGALVLAMTDGASDLLPIDWIAEDRDRLLKIIRTKGPEAVSDHFLHELEIARDEETGGFLHAYNMTLVIAAWVGCGELQ